MIGEELGEGVAEAHLLGIFFHAVGGAELGLAGGVGDGIVEAADFIDEMEAEGFLAGPDAALGDGFNGGLGEVATVGDFADELVIKVVDAGLGDGEFLGGLGAGDGLEVGEFAGLDGIEGHAEGVVEELLRVVVHAEDADGAGDGVGLGENVVGVGRDPVAAGSGVVARRRCRRGC